MERKNIVNILKVRSYKLPDSIQQFIESEDEQLLVHKINDPTDKLFVFFPQMSKVGVNTIRQYTKSMEDENVVNAIIVYDNSITAFAKQQTDQNKNINIEYFKKSELMVDKISHVLVPKHELISDEEKKELLKIYKIKDMHVPKIYSTDQIAKYFGAKRGQVFKITRNTETSGESIYYRIVV
jgi:DNA-directed RNA polymerase I, II, and III subunit RPABC1